MQVTKVTIDYQANYNGCTVILNDEFDEYDMEDIDETLYKNMQLLQDAVIEKAYEDCIKSGRHEGEFNGDEEELQEFAVKRATELFGEGIAIVFEMDECST